MPNPLALALYAFCEHKEKILTIQVASKRSQSAPPLITSWTIKLTQSVGGGLVPLASPPFPPPILWFLPRVGKWAGVGQREGGG